MLGMPKHTTASHPLNKTNDVLFSFTILLCVFMGPTSQVIHRLSSCSPAIVAKAGDTHFSLSISLCSMKLPFLSLSPQSHLIHSLSLLLSHSSHYSVAKGGDVCSYLIYSLLSLLSFNSRSPSDTSLSFLTEAVFVSLHISSILLTTESTHSTKENSLFFLFMFIFFTMNELLTFLFLTSTEADRLVFHSFFVYC